MSGQVEKVRPILLGLDASTTAVGWALVLSLPKGEKTVLGLGTFIPTAKDPWDVRVDAIGLFLDGLFREWGERTEVVAYEVATGNRGNMRTNRLLGAVEYETLARARDWNLATFAVVASQTKARVRQIMARRLALACNPGASEHAIDAVAVGLAALWKTGR
jgi:hypothetical protein